MKQPLKHAAIYKAHKNDSYPTLKALCEDVGISIRTAQRWLKYGYIRGLGRGHGFDGWVDYHISFGPMGTNRHATLPRLRGR